MKWLVKAEIIWVFSLLTEMMSYVFCMKNQTFKRTFLKMENKRLDKKKKR